MKKRSILNLLITFLFGVMFSLFLGCGGAKTPPVNKNQVTQNGIYSNVEVVESPVINENTNQDTFIPIQRQINGTSVNLRLDGKFHWRQEYEGHEYPLEIKEVYPGIVYFDKYHEDIVLPYHSSDSMQIERKVHDRIEFFQDQKLVNTFVIDEHNPYLSSSKDILVRNHYSDAERTGYVPPSERQNKGPVTTYHLRQWVENQEALTKVIYWKNELTSDQGWIIGTASTMIILDSLGRQIFKHEYKGFCSMPAVSPDGRYALFAILSVETVENAGFKTQTEGFELWDTQKEKLLHRELNDDLNMRISSPGITSDQKYLKIKYSYPNSSTIAEKIVAFNLSEKIIYWRVFNDVERLDKSKNWFIKYKTYDNLMNYFDFKKQEFNYGK